MSEPSEYLPEPTSLVWTSRFIQQLMGRLLTFLAAFASGVAERFPSAGVRSPFLARAMPTHMATSVLTNFREHSQKLSSGKKHGISSVRFRRGIV